MCVVVQVATAEAGGCDADLDFVRGGRGEGAGFLVGERFALAKKKILFAEVSLSCEM